MNNLNNYQLDEDDNAPWIPPTPNLADLEAWLDDGGCEATDGCWVEPDGVCPHGCQSWLIVLGMI